MTIPVWPASLPQAPLVAGLTIGDDDAVLRTSMDAGPATRRNRFTAITQSAGASILLTGAQLATFNAFYRDTLHNGTFSFEWTHPGTGQTVSYAFKGPVKFSLVRPDGDPAERLWQGTLDLEVQP
ncbi:MAG TPA: hypothetical protein VK090_06235 [Paracoccaceae bacterium]|nr:hypothetical protein [Paracoccaceae bacterium]